MFSDHKTFVDYLEEEIGLDNLATAFDVDDSLVHSGKHSLTPDRSEIMWGLHTHTGGASAIVTNNTLTKIDPMLPGYPAIGEHGKVWRLVPHTGLDKAVLKCQKMDIVGISDFVGKHLAANGIAISSESDRHVQGRGIILEHKMATFGVNFPKPEFKDKCVSACNAALKHFGMTSARLFIGPDSVEVYEDGFGKEFIDLYLSEPFQGKKIMFFGDAAGSDNALMKRLFNTNSGFGVAVGNEIPDGDHIKFRADGPEGVWPLLGELCSRFESRSALQPREMGSLSPVVAATSMASRLAPQ